MICGKSEMDRYVPHRRTMQLLDRVMEFDPADPGITVELDVHPGATFFDPALQGIPSHVGFEYIAQAVAALSGVQAVRENRPARRGFIMAVNDYQALVSTFGPGSCLQIRVVQVFRDGHVGSFAGRIFCDGRELAHGALNCIEVDDTPSPASHTGEGNSK